MPVSGDSMCFEQRCSLAWVRRVWRTPHEPHRDRTVTVLAFRKMTSTDPGCFPGTPAPVTIEFIRNQFLRCQLPQCPLSQIEDCHSSHVQVFGWPLEEPMFPLLSLHVIASRCGDGLLTKLVSAYERPIPRLAEPIDVLCQKSIQEKVANAGTSTFQTELSGTGPRYLSVSVSGLATPERAAQNYPTGSVRENVEACTSLDRSKSNPLIAKILDRLPVSVIKPMINGSLYNAHCASEAFIPRYPGSHRQHIE